MLNYTTIPIGRIFIIIFLCEGKPGEFDLSEVFFEEVCLLNCLTEGLKGLNNQLVTAQ